MVARPAAAIFSVTPILPAGAPVRMLHGERGPSWNPEASWNVVDRPRRKGVIEFSGYPPRLLTVEAALSFADVERSIEVLLFEVERQLIWPVGPNKEPPVVRIQGPGVPPMMQMLTWVTQKITPDEDRTERNTDGTRNLCFFTLEFLENSRPGVIITGAGSPAQTVQMSAASIAPAGSSSRTYTVRAGDSLGIIAQQQLGDYNRWQEIATLNGIRDPAAVTVGQLLRLP